MRGGWVGSADRLGAVPHGRDEAAFGIQPLGASQKIPARQVHVTRLYINRHTEIRSSDCPFWKIRTYLHLGERGCVNTHFATFAGSAVSLAFVGFGHSQNRSSTFDATTAVSLKQKIEIDAYLYAPNKQRALAHGRSDEGITAESIPLHSQEGAEGGQRQLSILARKVRQTGVVSALLQGVAQGRKDTSISTRVCQIRSKAIPKVRVTASWWRGGIPSPLDDAELSGCLTNHILREIIRAHPRRRTMAHMIRGRNSHGG